MHSLTSMDPERTIEFEFVRATENAALNSLPWLGRSETEKADGAACDAICGVFDLVDICGEVVICGKPARHAKHPDLLLGKARVRIGRGARHRARDAADFDRGSISQTLGRVAGAHGKRVRELI